MLLGLVIGLVFMYFVLRPKLRTAKEIDKKTEEQNQELWEKRKKLNEELDQVIFDLREKNQQLNYVCNEISALKASEAQIKENIEKTREMIENDNQVIYQKSFDLMQEKLSRAAEQEADKFQEAQRRAEEEYLKALEDIAQETAAALASKREEVKIAEQQLATLRAKADAAIAAAKREEEKLLEIDKYKILVTDLDLLEINRLREIAPYFRNARAIYKIIWESYYRNLTTEMVNRVVGAGTRTGVYKLTNLTNQKVYIGQAVDIGERFKQHTKCGLGIDTPSNMLYTAMLKDGVENFTFEVLEECERGQLNDREKYYINFYRAQEHGYNMSRGGARN